MKYKFFTREGGVSEGLYASLNCGPGSKDNPYHVAENRARAARAFGIDAEQLFTLHQIHSAEVVNVIESRAAITRPQADAMVTNRRGVMLGILTADCTPVLFYDAKARVIGAAHAGWKGAHGGVLENTILAMKKLGASTADMRVMIGPCIQQKSYEIGPEFYERFAPELQKRYFIPAAREEHFMFDLPAYVRSRLIAAGVTTIENNGQDTLTSEKEYFSYRRSTLRNEPDYGRQLSAIMLQE
ncbi:MAG: peptidoglycan editing factor PgeF [Alphaproteobacteria bacterium]|nr:peptidoglycan editing factor PgeF [Alphaproteobacteria bacterium]